MSQPEHQEIVEQIRTSRIVASPELRARVRAIAAGASVPVQAPPHRRPPWRRAALVLVPTSLAVALAAALAIGLTSSGRGPNEAARQARGGAADTAAQALKSAAPSVPGAGGAGAALPTSPGRAQLYGAELTLKVADLSAATKRALRLTRDFHGYVRSVDYGSGSNRGTATIVVRVPVGSVQQALVKYSAIGRILDQHVSIQDVQPQVDAQFRRLQAQRDEITKLQAALENPGLSADDRTALEHRLVAARRQLTALQQEQAALRRQTSYATVSLDLRSRAQAVTPPTGPGRIGGALHRAGGILAAEAQVLVYVLIVGAPFFVLGALVAGGLRLRRRHAEDRLLSTS